MAQDVNPVENWLDYAVILNSFLKNSHETFRIKLIKASSLHGFYIYLTVKL